MRRKHRGDGRADLVTAAEIAAFVSARRRGVSARPGAGAGEPCGVRCWRAASRGESGRGADHWWFRWRGGVRPSWRSWCCLTRPGTPGATGLEPHSGHERMVNGWGAAESGQTD